MKKWTFIKGTVLCILYIYFSLFLFTVDLKRPISMSRQPSHRWWMRLQCSSDWTSDSVTFSDKWLWSTAQTEAELKPVIEVKTGSCNQTQKWVKLNFKHFEHHTHKIKLLTTAEVWSDGRTTSPDSVRLFVFSGEVNIINTHSAGCLRFSVQSISVFFHSSFP